MNHKSESKIVEFAPSKLRALSVPRPRGKFLKIRITNLGVDKRIQITNPNL